jgi:hypothetical protein
MRRYRRVDRPVAPRIRDRPGIIHIEPGALPASVVVNDHKDRIHDFRHRELVGREDDVSMLPGRLQTLELQMIDPLRPGHIIPASTKGLELDFKVDDPVRREMRPETGYRRVLLSNGISVIPALSQLRDDG